ncbi:LacI family DNA-binding transcriptional regulator [Streptacidiphilus neutrinimicus]|uniref:LacI family DNA-binding transcriptional regulator n=1 Tax=Streptacidiphilus neutrinimicus TaxID=105420 RepID=UPI000A012DB1|nr:LacI family DNA-binding transcriptional regulator [Streptacidiphilus neutrinimicus]
MSRDMEDAAVRRPPTMTDVAQRAGVSHQTVSRVLSKHPHVREETREVVLRAIEELGYRRNSAARALVTRRTQTLGVVACHPALFGPASTLLGIEEAAREEGYTVSTVNLRRYTRTELADAIDHLQDRGVEGIVVIVPQRQAVSALKELKVQLPVVTVEGGHDLDLPSVSVDQQLGARLATGHLLAAGYGTVWHVAGPPDWLEAEARSAGWRATLEEAGVQVPAPLVGDWTPLSGYRVGQELAGRVAAAAAGRRSAGRTAVFVANDQMALGLLRAVREAGLSVPDDLAVVGFDDIPEAEFFLPPLTTVRQNFTAVGQASIRLLLGQLDGQAARPDERVVIAPSLIIRSSSVPATH